MRKLAIFAEGLTEQILMETLVREVVGARGLCIDTFTASGGRRSRRRFRRLIASAPSSGEEYYVQIINCGGDERVKSDIRDRYEQLAACGFCSIIGVRDAYPEVAHAEVARLRDGLSRGLKTKPIEVTFVLGVMEIETWFITEDTHFGRIDSGLTLGRIKATVGFDPSTDDVQLRPQPAKDLDCIYRIVGKRYDKTEDGITWTVKSLDCARVYCELGEKLDDVRVLVAVLDKFLG